MQQSRCWRRARCDLQRWPTRDYPVRECDTFYRCAVDKLTYPEVIEHYTFNKGKWVPRVCRSTTLGRMHVCTPAAGERFYLRLLLARVKGPVSFSALRCTADGTVHGSFQAACVARNLVADDHEWAGAAADLCRHVMNQGALHVALCTLFANCRLNDPATVLQDNLGALVCTWQRDDQQLCPPVVMPAEAYWQRLLRAFDSALRQTGSCNIDVGLPAPEPDCVLGGAEAHTLGGKVYADPCIECVDTRKHDHTVEPCTPQRSKKAYDTSNAETLSRRLCAKATTSCSSHHAWVL